MCLQCIVEAKEYWHPFPDWYLTRAEKDAYSSGGPSIKKGDWMLGQINDPLIIIRGELIKNEDPDDETLDNDPTANTPYVDTVAGLQEGLEVWDGQGEIQMDSPSWLYLTIEQGYLLYKTCLEAGWDGEGLLMFFLIDYLARVVESGEKETRL